MTSWLLAPPGGVSRGRVLLPASSIRHTHPRLSGWKRLPPLQEFERDPVRRLDERHVAVARRAVDVDARCLKPRAGRIDVVHDEGEMAEIARPPD